ASVLPKINIKLDKNSSNIGYGEGRRRTKPKDCFPSFFRSAPHLHKCGVSQVLNAVIQPSCCFGRFILHLISKPLAELSGVQLGLKPNCLIIVNLVPLRPPVKMRSFLRSRRGIGAFYSVLIGCIIE
ncbi:MAG: hypothetical protein KAT75_02525, partial [Dehalococcoidia bacterium]|nr:hypothetical protein [Dehalococcoidia bacterium]